jgi:hypothetical protein
VEDIDSLQLRQVPEAVEFCCEGIYMCAALAPLINDAKRL